MAETENNFLMAEKEYWSYLNRQSAVRDYNSAINGAHAEGRVEGQDQILRLVNELVKAGRTYDFAKMLADKSLIEKFYQEFNIT